MRPLPTFTDLPLKGWRWVSPELRQRVHHNVPKGARHDRKMQFTKTRIMSLEPVPGKRITVYDEGQKGLCIRVTPLPRRSIASARWRGAWSRYT